MGLWDGGPWVYRSFSTSRCIQQAKSIASYSRKGSIAADATHASADHSRARPALHVSTTPSAGPCPVVQRSIEALEGGRQSRRLGAEAATSASKDRSRCKWFLIWSFDCKWFLISDFLGFNGIIYFNRHIKILDCRALSVLLAHGPMKFVGRPWRDHTH
jgi:hypothetical protein